MSARRGRTETRYLDTDQIWMARDEHLSPYFLGHARREAMLPNVLNIQRMIQAEDPSSVNLSIGSDVCAETRR